ncbi:MarR family winged helix-turn-helix transcriptional regulator [Micropruina sp.]|uniref:MarR family winged helix-turn-helix transcriptional regulator n=1 Tax=Micropruina sp. TaxID=2737536 RepID=UPI0039E404A7
MPDHDRAALLHTLVTLVRQVGWASERVGHGFASNQGLHPTDLRALTAIYAADLATTPLTLRELAAQLDVTPAAVTYAVDRLTSAGHVRRERGTRDRRTVVLRFGEHGHQVAHEFFTPLGELHTNALADFSDAELDACARVLSVVNAALERFDRDLRTSSQAERANP